MATILPREGGPARWSVTFAVDDVDAITARARELGGSVLAEPQNAPWVRFAVLADPAGASFTASQFVAENHEGTKGAQYAGRGRRPDRSSTACSIPTTSRSTSSR